MTKKPNPNALFVLKAGFWDMFASCLSHNAIAYYDFCVIKEQNIVGVLQKSSLNNMEIFNVLHINQVASLISILPQQNHTLGMGSLLTPNLRWVVDLCGVNNLCKCIDTFALFFSLIVVHFESRSMQDNILSIFSLKMKPDLGERVSSRTWKFREPSPSDRDMGKLTIYCFERSTTEHFHLYYMIIISIRTDIQTFIEYEKSNAFLNLFFTYGKWLINMRCLIKRRKMSKKLQYSFHCLSILWTEIFRRCHFNLFDQFPLSICENLVQLQRPPHNKDHFTKHNSSKIVSCICILVKIITDICCETSISKVAKRQILNSRIS
ncbi:hypothetical protein EGR_00341 [Echinococcus granulosus]|uniref:Uncharacterized protein n=1 Tax=Echinococcus granulosus TaxID=6210 RepID=W6V281_ECHGR|nr:hypothetical protein EGR_00341 [Echinococcus granulosus]EUB65072.1 hypothetical protein EGR_00341 [Echinococcus granulosus]